MLITALEILLGGYILAEMLLAAWVLKQVVRYYRNGGK